MPDPTLALRRANVSRKGGPWRHEDYDHPTPRLGPRRSKQPAGLPSMPASESLHAA